MAAWSRLQHNLSGLSLRVVFVTNSSGARLATGCPEGARVEIARDPGGHAASRYNARWRPRAYLLDGAGRLMYAQPDTTLDPQAPLEVEALLKQTFGSVREDDAAGQFRSQR